MSGHAAYFWFIGFATGLLFATTCAAPTRAAADVDRVAATAPSPAPTSRAAALYLYALTLQPRVDRMWAAQLAAELDRVASKYETDPWISLAIAMQESSLRPGAVGPGGDAGTFQFHPSTARRFGVDVRRLRSDLAYEVEQHVLLLKLKLEMCPGPRGWSCYHSVTPRHRAKYERLVRRYLRGRAK